ncbi:MAG: S46 family peptidase [Pseudomonadota bacterium]
MQTRNKSFKNNLIGGTIFAVFGIVSLPFAAIADEGMWTFDAFPSAKVQTAYGFTPTRQWLNHVQNSAVRLSVGCSASFVSPNGLILTNWHCSADCTANLTTAEHDYGRDGFFARRQEDEKVCPGLSAEVLTSITDVTAQILSSTRGKTGGDISTAREAAISAAEERACQGLDAQKYRCDVVNLYRGGQYKVYKYRTYNDVRLVFEPEYAVGFFGGDPDNFNFPRYNLDASFLRAYENGAPVRNVEYLQWTNEVPQNGDLVFVAGNPGSTQRLRTTDQLAFQRDWVLPTRQLVRSEVRGRLTEYVNGGETQRREAGEVLFSLENSFKAQYGQMRALMDPEFFGIKTREEADLKRRVRANPALLRQIGDPWATIRTATAKQRDLFMPYEFLEARAGSISGLYGYAKQLVRAAYEREKPAGERLPGYSQSGLAQLERRMLAETPTHKDQEIIGLETWLSKTREYLTVDDANVQNMLGRESPEALARRLVNGTTLADPAVRAALLRGGRAAIDASTDPMIQFVLRTDANARAIRARYVAEVDGPMSQAAEKIAQARFAAYGANLYPDATFTLRLSYGKVQGWTYNGIAVPSTTKMSGAFERATGAFPFELAPSWVAARSRIDPNIAFDISSTNDIIGGNSGSPLIDRQGRVVGAAFDGNIHSLGGDFAYDGRYNRTVSVTTAAVQEALTKIYGLDWLVNELNAR